MGLRNIFQWERFVNNRLERVGRQTVENEFLRASQKSASVEHFRRARAAPEVDVGGKASYN